MVHLPQIREEHVKYISELARYSNEVKKVHTIMLGSVGWKDICKSIVKFFRYVAIGYDYV